MSFDFMIYFQLLDNNEKCGKNDMTDLFGRVKRYEEEARIDNDEVRQALTRTSQALEERLLRDKVHILSKNVYAVKKKLYFRKSSGRCWNMKPMT